MKPMKAHIYEPHRWAFGTPCWVQPKFNGIRALYQNGKFQSCDELPWNEGVLAHLAAPLLKLFEPHVILDGELYRHGWNLQRINGAVAINRLRPNEETLEVGYYVFDKVDYTKPFFIRFNEVEGIIRSANHPRLNAATTVKVPSRDFVEEFYVNTVADGFEGIMYRLGLCPYTVPKQPKEFAKGFLSDKDNRTWHLLKRKDWQDGEFECIGVEEGIGKRSGMVGAFVCRVFHGTMDQEFRVGSGLSDSDLTKYFQQPDLAIGHKIRVKFLTFTSDGKPFNPTIEAIL